MSYADALSHLLPRTSGPTTEEVNWLAREFPDDADQRQYAQERCIVAVTEALGEAMQRANLNRADLAKRLGVTKSHVSQLFAGRNLTLRTVADVLWACKLEVRDLDVASLGVMVVPVDQANEWKRSCHVEAVGAKGSIEVNIDLPSSYSPRGRTTREYSYDVREPDLLVGSSVSRVDESTDTPIEAANNNFALAA